MSKQSRLYGLIVMVVLALVAGGVGTLLLTASGKASAIDLTSADYVPADADLYVALNTDLTSSQWLTALSLGKKLSGSDPLSQARSDAGTSGFNWNNDVGPFLGGDAGIYLRNVSTSLSDLSGAAIIRCKDSARALATIQDKSGLSFAPRSHDGQSYLATDDGTVFAATKGDHLIVTNDEQTLFSVFDVKAGKSSALSSVDNFKTLRNELAGNFLAFIYVSPTAIAGDLAKDSGLVGALASIPTGSAPLAFELGAKSRSFELQSASIKGSGAVPLALQQHTSRFASLVPADTSVFISTNGAAQGWQAALAARRSQIDQAISQGTDYDSLDQALQARGRQIGVATLQDLVSLLTGETALAVRTSGSDPSAVLLAEVSDTSQAESMLANIAGTTSNGAVSTEQVGKITLTVFSDSSGDQLAYAIADGYVIVGSYADVKSVIAQPAAVLADRAAYQASVRETPVGLGSYAYVDVAGLAGAFGSDITANVPGLAAIQGFIVNAVEANGVLRVSGVLAVGN